MKGIRVLETTDPALNLATEDWLFRHLPELPLDLICLLYVNAPCFVVGKSQNIFREVDWIQADERGIPCYRRISGGGAVYQDLGNLNVSFILPRQEKYVCRYEILLEPVIKCLQSLGIPAELANQSDLRLSGSKISGNAQALSRQVLLQHGTVLFNTKLDAIHQMLHHRQEGFIGSAVSSRQSSVTNCSQWLAKGLGEGAENQIDSLAFSDFVRGLTEQLSERLNLEEFSLSPDQQREIEQIRQDRYLCWDWNFGRSPAFVLQRPALGREWKISVEKGIIRDIQIHPQVVEDGQPNHEVGRGFQDDKISGEIQRIRERWTGAPLKRKTLLEKASGVSLSAVDCRRLLEKLFGPTAPNFTLE